MANLENYSIAHYALLIAAALSLIVTIRCRHILTNTRAAWIVRHWGRIGEITERWSLSPDLVALGLAALLGLIATVGYFSLALGEAQTIDSRYKEDARLRSELMHLRAGIARVDTSLQEQQRKLGEVSKLSSTATPGVEDKDKPDTDNVSDAVSEVAKALSGINSSISKLSKQSIEIELNIPESVDWKPRKSREFWTDEPLSIYTIREALKRSPKACEVVRFKSDSKPKNARRTNVICFEPDRYDLGDRVLPRLDLAKGLTADERLLIIGHADKRGAALYNLDLSVRRANAVRNALVQNLDGSTKRRIHVAGHGEIESDSDVPKFTLPSATEPRCMTERKDVAESRSLFAPSSRRVEIYRCNITEPKE